MVFRKKSSIISKEFQLILQKNKIKKLQKTYNFFTKYFKKIFQKISENLFQKNPLKSSKNFNKKPCILPQNTSETKKRVFFEDY